MEKMLSETRLKRAHFACALRNEWGESAGGSEVSLRRRFVDHLTMWVSRLGRGRLVRLILLGGLSMSMGEPSQETTIEGITGRERILLTSGESRVLVGLPEDLYLKRVAPLTARGSRNVLLMQQRPGPLSPQARFGMDFKVDGDIRFLGWIVDGNEKDGYVLYADLNTNGDLTDDPPIRFEKENGEYARTFGVRKDSSSPGIMKLVIVHETPFGESEPTTGVRVHRQALRKGLIRVGDRNISFGLIGIPRSYQKVVFDLNGDGKLECVPGSREFYHRREQFVRIDETDYELMIDTRNGDKLQLKPLPELRAETEVLRPGYPPPDFTFRDLDGKTHRLSDYRGKVVLLDFWFMSCVWCQEIIPEMVQTYNELHGKGLEIIGINGVDSEETLRPFLAEKKITWPQTIQHKTDSPVYKRYRVSAAPIYYLIDRDGKIAAQREGGEGILAEVVRLVAGPSSAVFTRP